MKLTVLASGSHANGYIIQNESEALIIEAGVRWSECLKALDYNSQKVSACLISHEHGDHAKYIDQYLDAALPVYGSQGTLRALNTKSRRQPISINPMQTINIGSFKVLPFDTRHDSKQPIGFLIQHPEIGTLLFATDTYYLKYRFEGLTQVLIECNYSLDMLNQNTEKGIIHPLLRNRTLRSHMSVDNTIKTLQANNLQRVNNIVLIHLSSKNSDPERFKQSVELATGKKVTIAHKGIELELNETL